MTVTAKRCVAVVSSWVHSFILTCDNELAVWFKHGARHGHGVPSVCCLYPKTTKAWFDAAIAWSSPGHFVDRFLYKKRPYRIIRSPCPAAGCGVTVACCSGAIPTTLHGTFSDFSGGVPCAGGAPSFVLTWDGTSQWVGSGVLGTCGHTLDVKLYCSGTFCTSMMADVAFPDGCGTNVTGLGMDGTCTCTPVHFRTVLSVRGCGGGGDNLAYLTITV